jgi:hypothetical protein
MSNLDKLAKLFSARDNPFLINITKGDVISVNPVRIKYGDNIILEAKHLYIADSLISGYSGEYTDDNGTTTETKNVTVKNSLQVGDKVMMIPDTSFKYWYIIDKVVKM